VLPDAVGAERALLGLLLESFAAEGVDIADVCTSNRRMLEAARGLGMTSRKGIEIACRFGPDTSDALHRARISFQSFEGDYGEGDVIFA